MRPNLRLQVAIRLAADAVMLAAALCSGVVLFFGFGISTAPVRVLLLRDLAVLLLVGLPVVYAGGVYTRARTYRLRFKVLSVARSVSAAFALLVLIDALLGPPHLPLGAATASWFFALAVLTGSRIWSSIWIWLMREDTTHTELLAARRAQNVLLIGGAGYIGSALLPKLLAEGYHVRLLDSFVYGKDPIANCLNHPNLEVIHADFRQVDRMVGAMQGIGTVIHLGAIVGDPACALNEELTIEVNLIATRMIAEVAKGQGVSRFIFASTCSVYGASDQILDERSALNPVSLYARSKVACEKVLLGLRSNHFHPVLLRFGTVYGLSGRTRFDLVINLLSAKAELDGVITVFGGEQWRPFVHVDDAAQAILMSLQVPLERLQQYIFNVGSDEQNRTLADVGNLIREMVPSAVLTCTDLDAVDRRNYRVDFSRIREALHFQPRWTIERGVAQVLEAIRSGKVRDYGDPQYSNVKFLSEEVGRNKLPVQNGWAKELVQSWDNAASSQIVGRA